MYAHVGRYRCKCEAQKVRVWCDMDTDGGGWTVFLTRQKQTPQLEFNRSWVEYRSGFGDPHGEYWLGESPSLTSVPNKLIKCETRK